MALNVLCGLFSGYRRRISYLTRRRTGLQLLRKKAGRKTNMIYVLPLHHRGKPLMQQKNVSMAPEERLALCRSRLCVAGKFRDVKLCIIRVITKR